MTVPLLDHQLRRPLSWSLMALWAMCCLFIVIVVILGVTLMQRMDAIAARTEGIAAEQMKRTGVITEMQFLRDEIGRMRAIQTEKVVVLEQARSQIQINTLDIARLQKQVDWLQAQMQDLRYGQRGGTGPLVPEAPVDPVPRSPAHGPQ